MTANDCCQEYSVNAANVMKAKESMPDSGTLELLARMFQGFGDINRLKILHCVKDTELCVCELGEVLEMSAPAVSHHLRRLKDLGLVKTRRDKKLVYYSLDDGHISQLLSTGLEHLEHRF